MPFKGLASWALLMGVVAMAEADPNTEPETFSLIVSEGPISALLGSSITLPCSVDPQFSVVSLKTTWYRPTKLNTPILQYENQKVQTDPSDAQYRGRVSLVGQLNQGSVSMRLDNLTLADRGEYVCYVQSNVWYEEATMSLVVEVPQTFSLTVPEGPISAPLGSFITLPCSVSPLFSVVPFAVRWYRLNQPDKPLLTYQNKQMQQDPADAQYRGRVSLVGPLDQGDVSMRLEKLTLADRGVYVCYVGNEGGYEEARVSVDVEDEQGLVQVSSWLLHSPSESESLSCSVGLSDQERRVGRIVPYICISHQERTVQVIQYKS
ncbi:cell surface A33 antigen-like [Engraulis encrasicolus]|uniref:cell surface A33 antigen-like n=1 Tax=Engraulis encrasicolus TaxID=184585 RepID=UPI002FD3231A